MKTGEKYASKKHTPTQKLQTKGMLSKKVHSVALRGDVLGYGTL